MGTTLCIRNFWNKVATSYPASVPSLEFEVGEMFFLFVVAVGQVCGLRINKTSHKAGRSGHVGKKQRFCTNEPAYIARPNEGESPYS